MNKIFHFIFLIFIILIIYQIIYQTYYFTYREPFIPKKIKEYYRPIRRQMRIGYEGFYSKSYLSLSNLFRKFQII